MSAVESVGGAQGCIRSLATRYVARAKVPQLPYYCPSAVRTALRLQCRLCHSLQAWQLPFLDLRRYVRHPLGSHLPLSDSDEGSSRCPMTSSIPMVYSVFRREIQYLVRCFERLILIMSLLEDPTINGGAPGNLHFGPCAQCSFAMPGRLGAEEELAGGIPRPHSCLSGRA